MTHAGCIDAPFGQRLQRIFGGLLWLICCALPSGIPAAELNHYRIRLQWQDETAASVRGRISLDAGRLSDVRNLSFDGATTGGLLIGDNDRDLFVEPRGIVPNAGVLLRAIAPPTTSLVIDLSRNDKSRKSNSTAQPITIPLVEITEQPQAYPIDEQRRVWVSRVTGDGLRIESNASSQIFNCGTEWPVTLIQNGLSLDPDRMYLCRAEIVKARDGTVEQYKNLELRTDSDGKFAPTPLTMKVPSKEGAYDLQFHLSLPQRFQRERNVVTHRIQFVALSSNRVAPSSEAWKELATLAFEGADASDRNWLRSQLPPWLPGGLGAERASTRWSNGSPTFTETNGERCLELSSDASFAMEIPKLEIGKPHQLIVRVPAKHPARLQVCIAEPDANGKFQPLQIDTAVVVPQAILDVPEEWTEHRVVFWPKTSNPLLLLSNRHPRTSVTIAPVRIAGGIDRLPVNSLKFSASTDRTNAIEEGDRTAALYLAKPTLPEAFGASLMKDAENGAMLHDWVSFLESGQRLIEYLQWAGYSGAMLNVSSEGGTLYPTSLIASTARYDSGAFYTHEQDVQQKDVLELLLRLFDRANLKLTATIELSTPLIELENQLRTKDFAPGVEPMNGQGDRLVDLVAPMRGQATYYNALDPRVQSAIKHMMIELKSRYQDHPSFAGIGIQLGPRQFAQLPESSWNLDPATVASFGTELPGKLPETMSVKDWIAGAGRPQFLRWRSARHSEFMSAIGKLVHPYPLYLIGTDFNSPTVDVTQPELEYGWDWESLASQPNIVPLRYYRSRPLSGFAQQIADTSLEGDAALDRRYAALDRAGAVLDTPLEKTASPQFTTDGPWTVEQAPEFLLPHAVSAGEEARLRLARALAPNDRWPLLVGGWSPPRGSEAFTAGWLSVYQSLPARRFENLPSVNSESKGGLTIARRLKTQDAFYAYLVNTAPWGIEIDLELLNPEKLEPEFMAATDCESQVTSERIRALLTAGSIVAIRIDDPQADIRAWSTTPLADQSLVRHCAERLNQLNMAAHDAQEIKPTIEIPNHSFEMEGQSVPMWNTSQDPMTRAHCDSSTAASGKASLCLESQQESAVGKAWAISQVITVPMGARLAVTARVRSSVASKATVRMALEAKVRGQPWRRTLVIPNSQIETATASAWPATLQRLEVTDLPLAGVEDVRVAFDLTGPGKVWIDDVQVANILLTNAERKTLQEDLYLAIQRLKQDDISAAGRLLGYSWTRELLSLAKKPAPVDVAEPAPPVVPPTETPRTADRLRSWIPRILR